MKKLVVDASVAIKWFIPEIHSDDAMRLFDSDAMLFAPDLIGPEIGNTVWKKARRGEITPHDALAILSAFPSVGMDIYPSRDLLTAAWEIASALDRSLYDSLYLALAVAYDCPVVTADRRFHTSVLASQLASHIQWVEEVL